MPPGHWTVLAFWAWRALQAFAWTRRLSLVRMEPFDGMLPVRTPGSISRCSPWRALNFCLPPSGTRSATSTTIDFGADTPFTLVPAYNLPVYASQGPLPDTTQELGYAAAGQALPRSPFQATWSHALLRRNPPSEPSVRCQRTRLLPWMSDVEALIWPGMADDSRWYPGVDDPVHPLPRHIMPGAEILPPDGIPKAEPGVPAGEGAHAVDCAAEATSATSGSHDTGMPRYCARLSARRGRRSSLSRRFSAIPPARRRAGAGGTASPP